MRPTANLLTWIRSVQDELLWMINICPPSCSVNDLLSKPTSPTPIGQLIRNLVSLKHRGDRSKIVKIVSIAMLKIYLLFFFSSWTETPIDLKLGRKPCRSKIVKTVSIWNPRWPLWLPSGKSIIHCFSWTKRTFDLKLVKKHQGD